MCTQTASAAKIPSSPLQWPHLQIQSPPEVLAADFEGGHNLGHNAREFHLRAKAKNEEETEIVR